MVTTQIRDGNSNGNNFLKINEEGEIGVVMHTHPPFKESRASLPFRQYFTATGAAAGSNDMRVNGSSTAVDFWIPADPEEDIFIKFISIKLADASASLNKFGNLSALTNGVEFLWQSQSEGTLTIHDGIKDNLEFFRLSEMTPTIIDLSGGGADAVIVQWDLAKIFGSIWGTKLNAGTTDKLVFRVNDNLSTGIDEFNIIGHGTRNK
jgi:hypothetical protein